MFASILPGLRDARTPLAVGILWIATVWIWFGPLIPSEAEAGGLLEQIYRLTGVFGAAILLTALAFVAYVIGLLLSPLHLDWGPIRQLLPAPFQPLSPLSRYSIEPRFRDALKRAAEAGADPGVLDTFYPARRGAYARADYARGVDISLTAMRLQATHKDIYDDYDRFKSEAEFRRSIALPLGVVIASATLNLSGVPDAVRVSGLVVGGVVFVVLHLLSWRKSREGNDVIVQCILSGQVNSPSLEALEAMAANPSATTKKRASKPGPAG